MKRGENKVLHIARQEIKKSKRDKKIYYSLLSLSFITLLLLSLHLLELTGYVPSISSKGGYVTEVSIASKKDVNVWGGIYGLVLTVPSFTQQLSENLVYGEIQRSDIFFNCIQIDAEGGPEFYASTNPSLSLSTATVSPGTTKMIDEFINCTGEIYCANETFTKNMTIFLGSTNISKIPSTFTYKY